MKQAMSSRERMITAIRNEMPDSVPVAPDISNMIPAKMTGKPFWDIYFHNDPPLWKAYIEAVKYFGFDGWFIYGYVHFHSNSQVTAKAEIVDKDSTRVVQRITYDTPAGELWQEITCFCDSPSQITRGLIKDLKADFPKVKYLYPDIIGCDNSPIEPMRKELGDLGAFGVSVGLPGFQGWVDLFDGKVQQMTFDYYDNRDLMEELRGVFHRHIMQQTEILLEQSPDFLLIGASGSITLQSPAIFRELSLPTLQEITRLAKQARIPSMLHSCGKERDLVKICAEETELDCINPLEVPPMGDCDLATIKREYGDRLSLMGNIHTTEIMLNGSIKDVENAAKKCIDDAAMGGGYILSTGDQCGRDTPSENIFKLVEVARTYGRY